VYSFWFQRDSAYSISPTIHPFYILFLYQQFLWSKLEQLGDLQKLVSGG